MGKQGHRAAWGAAALCLALANVSAAQDPAPVDFQRDIQPIFRKSCLGCHSKAMASGQLRLDSRKLAMKGGISGAVIIPGDSQASRLMHRVQGLGGEKRMPLAGEPLSRQQVSLLARWIDEGAKWPDALAGTDDQLPRHWAYIAPRRPALPSVRQRSWVRNPIDAFVLAELEKEGLQPSPEASRETLIRRLSLDLIGLPPTPQQVDEFVNSGAADAYERLVDRLLASPHFGERWARPWLDLARYADTNGYEKDRRRSIWKYRDWVIGALNSDMPYDRFTIEQLAGDMLPQPTQDQWIATGFHRNTMFNEEGGVDKEEAHWEVLVDRVNTTATVWLGTTLGCAQCHNHKFDPFTQKEYYQLMAFFANTERGVRDYGDTSQKYIEPVLELPSPEQSAARKRLLEAIAAEENRMRLARATLGAAQAAWENRIRQSAGEWQVLQPQSLESTGGTTLQLRLDGSVLAGGNNPSVDDYIIETLLPVAKATAIRLEALPDPSLPMGGPGRDAYGNFFVSAMTVETAEGEVEFVRSVADDGRIEDKKFSQLWSVDASRESRRLPRQLVLIARAPFGSAGGKLRLRIRQKSEFGGQGLGCFRLSVTASGEPQQIVAVPARLRPILETDGGARNEADAKRLADYYFSIAPSLAESRAAIQRLRKEIEQLNIASTLIIREAISHQRPSATIRIRGTFTNPGETVYANVPAALHPLPDDVMPNRLGLARWLVSKDNPLIARVTVNRIWEQYFGRGIVETSEDFGTQGARPSHPQLLDWLAVEFMESGWKLKHIHRLIVTSAVYRQSSKVTAELLEKDPYNRLLARGARFRMEAEMLRDAALFAAGLLSPRIGGPSVFPYQPEGVWDLPYNDDQWRESQGEDRFRRGIYTFLRRTAPYPSLLVFDAPSREVCTVRRPRTNTPLQALTSLNDKAFFEAAQGLAARILREGGESERSRAEYAFRLCTARKPDAAELDLLLSAYRKELTYFANHIEEAERIARQAPEAAGTVRGSASRYAAWTMIANALLNLDETLSKE